MTGDVEASKLQHAQFSKYFSALYLNLQLTKTQILVGDGSIPSLSIMHSTILLLPKWLWILYVRLQLRMIHFSHFFRKTGPLEMVVGSSFTRGGFGGHGDNSCFGGCGSNSNVGG